MAHRSNWKPTLESVLKAAHSPVLKEIACIVGSPPLMLPSASMFMEFSSLEHLLEAFHNDLPSLEWPPPNEQEILGTKNIRLGNRFEKMLLWWLKRSDHFEVLASNLVIQGDQHTLGEMDLILENKFSGERVHLELACKFYLNASSSREWNQWIGAHSIDRLDIKINKLRRQLNLRMHPQTEQVLRKNDCMIQRSTALMKGWFFYHFRDLASPVRPLHSNPNAPSGWWCHYSDWKHIWTSHAHWILIQPEHWLRIRHHSNLSPLITPYGWKMERQQLVAQVEWQNQEWVELNRGMIVYDGWPMKT